MGLHHVPRVLPALSVILADLGQPAPSVWARAIGVSERTAWRWQAADEAPRAALLALYWVTRWGYSEIEAQARHELDTARLLVDSLRRDIAGLRARMAHLQAIGSFGASNDPLTDAPAPARSGSAGRDDGGRPPQLAAPAAARLPWRLQPGPGPHRQGRRRWA
jgi:hypothetical protein